MCCHFRCGVDKAVISLLRDRTEGNTMSKVWRQVLEGHCQVYLERKDMYTTLLTQYNQPGKITSKSDPHAHAHTHINHKTNYCSQLHSALFT